MKKFSKILSVALLVALVLSFGAMAYAADDDTPAIPEGGTSVTLSNPDALPTSGSITVNKAAKGETYTLYKVLDAQVGANGAIVYPGPVPSGLEDLFEVDANNNIQKKSGLSDADLFAGLKTWAASQTKVTDKVADGSTVVFDNLAFGYYVVTSSQNNGAAISVTSTNPDAVTYEKNETVPQPDKKVDDHEYSIGDTIEYTVTFPGANYMGSGENSKIVTKYEVSDTLPAFLSNAKVKSISIATDPVTTITGKDFVDKKFTIDWAAKDNDGKWQSLYPNGTVVTIVYTATLTSTARVGANNINTVTVKPYVETDTGEEPWNESWSDDEYVKTYALAVKKVDEEGKPLAGAKFKITGLTATKTANGVYTVTKYDPTNITLENSTEMEVDEKGMLYVVGLDTALTVSITETAAPTGYNKLATPVTTTTTQLTEEIYKISGSREYDAKGNIIAEDETETHETKVLRNLEDLEATALKVENNKGTVLPSTGGIGTTIFYVVGGVLVLAAIILLVTKKRMSE